MPLTQRHLVEANLNWIGDFHRRRREIGREQAHLLEGVIRLIEHIESRAPLSSLGVLDLAQIEKLAFDHASASANAFDNTPLCRPSIACDTSTDVPLKRRTIFILSPFLVNGFCDV